MISTIIESVKDVEDEDIKRDIVQQWENKLTGEF